VKRNEQNVGRGRNRCAVDTVRYAESRNDGWLPNKQPGEQGEGHSWIVKDSLIHDVVGTVHARCGGILRHEWLTGAAVFLLFWLVSRRYVGPAYLSDEIGYLGHAALLAGYTIDGASSYHAGYSLFLAPLFRLFSEPADIWQGVMVLNAATWAGSVLLLARLVAYFFPQRPALQRSASVAIAATYPTWLTMSGYAYSTTAVVFGFMLSLLAGLRIDARRKLSVLPYSLAVGFLYWIHPTALSVILASMVAMSILSLRKRQFVPLVLHIALVSLLVVAYRQGLHEWLLNVATPPGLAPNEHYLSYSDVVSHFDTLGFWMETVIGVIGQGAYLTIGSLGLVVLGVAEVVRCMREETLSGVPETAGHREEMRFVSLFLLLSLVFVLLMGSVAFSAGGHLRVDHWIYGRYAEGVLLPFLAVGFLARGWRRWLPLLAGAIILYGVLLNMTVNPWSYTLGNSIVAFWPQYLFGETRNYVFLWMAVGALGVFVFQVSRQEVGVGKGVALTLFVGLAVLSNVSSARYHEVKLEANQPSRFVEIVRENFDPRTRVGFNPQMPADAVLYQEQRFQLHLFYLYDYLYQRMYVSDWLHNCDGPLFTYYVDDLRARPGVVLLGQEVRSGLYLVAKDRAEGFQIPNEDPTERTFYPAKGWSLRQDVCRWGEGLSKLSSQVGKYEDARMVSTGKRGLLVYGPNVALNCGEYELTVLGGAPVVSEAWVAVVSGLDEIEHARFALSSTSGSEAEVLASGHVSLPHDVVHLEIKVYVGSDDDVRLAGYQLVPAGGQSLGDGRDASQKSDGRNE